MKKNALSLYIFATVLTLTATPTFADDLSTPMPMTEKDNERLLQMTGQIQSINEELSSQRANLGAMKAELRAQSDEAEAFRRDVLKELKALRRQNQSLVDSFPIISNDKSNSEIKPLRNYDLQTPDGKLYFGEDEYFYIKEADATFDARIDTGAAVSSISARNITEFERKGRKWYRFTIEANDHTIDIEAPYVRKSTIRQSSKETTTERVVVSLTIKVGSYSTQAEFTLADRTKLQYPLLIGRNIIQDIAVVDVSRDHIQARNKDTFLILSREDFEKNQKKGIDPNAEYKAKRASAAGQIAYPSQSYGANLGTNPEQALPVVRNKNAIVVEQTDKDATKATEVKDKDNKKQEQDKAKDQDEEKQEDSKVESNKEAK